VAGFVDEIDQYPFVVALEKAQFMGGAEPFAEGVFDLGESHGAIDVRFAGAK
jgi:hypothetical protein